MKKNINIKLLEKDKLVKEYKKIPSIVTEEKITFNIDNVKNILTSNTYIRENNEYLFNLYIKDKKCTLLLKEHNLEYDIKVEKISYHKKNNQIILEYKIESNESILRIEIEME